MPEGDSVAGNAEMLRLILEGRRIEAVAGSAGPVRSNSHRLLDAEVAVVRTVGKNLVIDLSTGYSVRVHLGMTGRWSRSEAPGSRLTLRTEAGSVSCSGAPVVEVDRTAAIDKTLAGLGPDLLGDFEFHEFLRRARAVGVMPVGRLLLDQRVVAGIGNVYKSELLFLVGINPWTPTDAIEDEHLLELAGRGKDLLRLNVGRRRSTTGSSGRGQETWVYDQAGHACRRCGTKIEIGRLDDRVTYWCPGCQPQSRESTGW